MATKCKYCSNVFDNIKQHDIHNNNIHKTEMYDIKKEKQSKDFWNLIK
jgi:hypothetical protein